MSDLNAKSLTFSISDRMILNDISLAFQKQELVAFVGPNGAGKSTLLRCLAGLSKPTNGRVNLGNHELFDLSPEKRAQKLAYLPQVRPIEWPITVKDLVALGRFSFGTPTGKLSSKDAEAITDAMINSSVSDLENRKTNTLSGGELTRAHCARIFAAKADYMLFDEPIAALDPRHQIAIIEMIRREVDNGACAIVVIHDLSIAARFADRLVWMKNGEIKSDGPALETLTPGLVEQTFGITAEILPHQKNAVILGDTVS